MTTETDLPQAAIVNDGFNYPRVTPLNPAWFTFSLITGLLGSLLLMFGFLTAMANYYAIAELQTLEDDPSALIIILLMAFTFLMGLLCFLPMIVIYCIMLYKSWKVVQPLRILAPEESNAILSPGLAVGLLFVPVFSCYWFFPASQRLWTFATKLSALREKEYSGPGKRLLLAIPAFMLLSSCFNLIIKLMQHMECWQGAILSSLAILVLLPVTIILQYLFCNKANRMVKTLGSPVE